MLDNNWSLRAFTSYIPLSYRSTNNLIIKQWAAMVLYRECRAKGRVKNPSPGKILLHWDFQQQKSVFRITLLLFICLPWYTWKPKIKSKHTSETNRIPYPSVCNSYSWFQHILSQKRLKMHFQYQQSARKKSAVGRRRIYVPLGFMYIVQLGRGLLHQPL